MKETYYLVYEVNMLKYCDIDAVEEEDMSLYATAEEAYAEMARRKQMYIEDKDNGFTYMENESCDNCIVFADDLWEDGETREGEFHIRMKPLLVK